MTGALGATPGNLCYCLTPNSSSHSSTSCCLSEESGRYDSSPVAYSPLSLLSTGQHSSPPAHISILGTEICHYSSANRRLRHGAYPVSARAKKKA